MLKNIKTEKIIGCPDEVLSIDVSVMELNLLISCILLTLKNDAYRTFIEKNAYGCPETAKSDFNSVNEDAICLVEDLVGIRNEAYAKAGTPIVDGIIYYNQLENSLEEIEGYYQKVKKRD